MLNQENNIQCLMCESASIRASEYITGAQLHDLWKIVGHNLSDKSMGKITDEFRVNLYKCGSCGFKFYDPSLAGTAEFYEELMSERAYPTASPEFGFAIEFAKANNIKRVLDIGGGEGAFLDEARKQGMETYGVELNSVAAKTAGAKGHHMFNKPMEQISPEEIDGGTDILTLFQVIEHVSSPVNFLSDAARLVRPGGYLVVGVPSERRMLGLLHYDPLNWPPHHVSRWRVKDLDELAKRAGLLVVKRGHDVLYGRAISWALKLRNQLAVELGISELLRGEQYPKLISFIYRYLGCKYYLGLHGLSIYAIMKKPA